MSYTPVRERQNKYVPISQKLGQEEEQEKNGFKLPPLTIEPKRSFFDPSPDIIRARDVLREIPGVTVDFAREFFTKPGVRLGLSITRFIKGGEQEFVPKTKLERTLLGDKPVLDFQTEGENLLKAVGASPERSKALGIPVGIAFGILDFIPPAKIPKTLVKTSVNIARTSDIKVITKELSTVVKGTDEEIKTLSIALASVDDAKEVETILRGLIKAKQEVKDGLRALKVAEETGQPIENVIKAQERVRDAQKEISFLKTIKGDGGVSDKISAMAREDFERAQSEVFAELEIAEAGKRLFSETGEGFTGVARSTFPDFISSDLRSRKLFDSVVKKIDEGQKVTGTKELRLVNEIQEEILRRMDVDIRDEVALARFAAELEEQSVKEADTFVRNLTRDITEKIRNKTFTLKQFVAGVERAKARTAKIVSKEVAGVERRAAKRQVAFEKREAKRKVGKERDRILTKLRETATVEKAVKDDIVKYVKDNLDPKDRGKAITLVRDAKTGKQLTKAFARINRWAEDAEKKIIRSGILKAQQRVLQSPSISIDFKKKIGDFLSDFQLRGRTEKTKQRLEATKKFLLQEAEKGNDVYIPRRLLKAVESLTAKPFSEITLNEAKGILAEIEMLEELGKTKFRTIQNIVDLEKQKIIRELELQDTVPIQNVPLIKPEIGERLTISQKARNVIISVRNGFSNLDKHISPMDVIFDILDGGKGTYDGALFKFFKGRIDAGYSRYMTKKTEMQRAVVELSEKHKLSSGNFERMGVVAAREQDGGIEKLIATGFTEKQINAVKLTAQEQEVLDLMRKTFDDSFPEVQDIMRRVYNQPVEKVKNYFSFMTDWKAMDDAEVFTRFGSQEPIQLGQKPRKNVDRGFTLTRTGGGIAIKINAMDVFQRHTDNVAYLTELGEHSKILGEVANSARFGEIVGDKGQLMVQQWIDVVARKGGVEGARQIAILDTLRKNVGAGILGLKLSSAAIQWTAVIDGMGFIGTGWGLRGISEYMTNPQWRNFVAKFPELVDRKGGEFALRELTDDTWLQEFQRKGFIPLQFIDRVTASTIATGAYMRKMTELGRQVDFNKIDDEALQFAQLAVRRTQSSGAFKDVPLAISRGAVSGNKSIDRAIFQFQNFLLTRWSRLRHDAIRAGINTGDAKKAIPPILAIATASLAAAGTRLGVNRITDFITGDEDDDEITQELLKQLSFELYGTVPFMGNAVGMWMYDAEFFPLMDAPGDVIDGLRRSINSKSPQARAKGLTDFVTSIGQLSGIPGSFQAQQLIKKSIGEPAKKRQTKQIPTPSGLPSLPRINSLPIPTGLPPLP